MAEDMGMTNKQFNGFLRLILYHLAEICNEMSDGAPKKKLERVMDILQDTLEDDGNR